MLRGSFHRAAAVLAVALLTAAPPVLPARADAPVTLFAAASTSDAVTAALARFRAARPEVAVRASYAASSTLAQQIARGAPADLYLSANQVWMNSLDERGLLAADSRVDLLENRLVLVVPRGTAAPKALADLPGWLGNRRLAMADPAHVPAGQYAETALRNLGIWTRLQGDRTAYANDVRAALALVARGAAPAGIVYATDARISDDVAQAETFPADSHPPIRYPLARIEGRDGRGARALYRFLTGPDAASVFSEHGFRLVDPTSAEAAAR